MHSKAPILEMTAEPNSHRILANLAYRSTTSTTDTTTLLSRFNANEGQDTPNTAAIVASIVLIFLLFCLILIGYALCVLHIPFAKYWRTTWNPLIVIFVFPYHIWRFGIWVKQQMCRSTAVKHEECDEDWSRTVSDADEELALPELRLEQPRLFGFAISRVGAGFGR